jgi:hypothetical protein
LLFQCLTNSYLVTWSVRVGKYKTRSNDVEGSINMHWIGVFKGNDMYSVVRSKMPTHPLNAQAICNLKIKGRHAICKDLVLCVEN